jgi:hypothetical protein
MRTCRANDIEGRSMGPSCGGKLCETRRRDRLNLTSVGRIQTTISDRLRVLK